MFRAGYPASRRSLLRGLGLGGASFGLGLPRTNRAHGGPIPTRFVVFVGDGMIYDDCWPTGTEASFELGEVHKPLEPWRSKLICLDGIGMVSEQIDPGPKGNAHQQGGKHALAAANTTRPDLPGGATIDQFIASRINSPAPVTKFRSLEFAINNWQGESPIIASGANTVIQPMWDPRKSYQRVFGDFVPPSPGAPPMVDVAREQQLAVLGFAKSEFATFNRKLGKDDKARLDAHLALLSDLEKSMALSQGGSTPSPACLKPAAPTGLERCHYACYNETQLRAANYRVGEAASTKIAAAALACDLTRVVSVQVGYGPDELYGYRGGMFGTFDMHDLVHKVCDRANALSRSAEARKVVKDQNLVEARTVATMLKELDAIPQADGKTLLDHTIVLWAGHIGYGSHDVARLPWVLIGGGAAGLRTGRYLKLPKNPASYRGLPHNDLFVSIAQLMGVQTNTFGNPDCCNGPLPGLVA